MPGRQKNPGQAEQGVDRVPRAGVNRSRFVVVARRAGDIAAQQRDLAQRIEHDTDAPGVIDFASDLEVLAELVGRLVVPRQQDEGPAGGTMRDRRPETVVKRPLQLQALTGEGQPIGGLALAEQKVRQGVANLGKSRREVAFVVNLVRTKIKTLGDVEVAMAGPE